MPTGTSTSFSISDELVPVSDPHPSNSPIHAIDSETNVSIGQQTVGPDTLKRLSHDAASDSNNISIKKDIASWILTEKHVPKIAISTLSRILHKHHKTLPLSIGVRKGGFQGSNPPPLERMTFRHIYMVISRLP